MPETKYIYSYDKEYDTVVIKAISSFNFTHFHRDLLLKAVQTGYVELRRELLTEEYSKAFDELVRYKLLKEDLDGWYTTGKVVNKYQAMKLVKCYNEE